MKMNDIIEYRYYVNGKMLYRMHIEPDDEPWNSRVEMHGNYEWEKAT